MSQIAKQQQKNITKNNNELTRTRIIKWRRQINILLTHIVDWPLSWRGRRFVNIHGNNCGLNTMRYLVAITLHPEILWLFFFKRSIKYKDESNIRNVLIKIIIEDILRL